MSWNPLKKIGSRPSAPPAPSIDELVKLDPASTDTLNIDRGVGDEFDRILYKVDKLDSVVKKISKAAKRTGESIVSLSRAESKLSKDIHQSMMIKQFYHKLDSLFHEWDQLNTKLADIAADYNVLLIKTQNEPCKKMSNLMHELRSILKKRDLMRENVQKLNVKIQQLSKKERTGNNIVQLSKLNETLKQSEDHLKKCSHEIISQLPAIIDQRCVCFQPSLEALIKANIVLWSESIQQFDSVTTIKENSVMDSSFTWNDYRDKQTKLINSISSLSIVEGGD